MVLQDGGPLKTVWLQHCTIELVKAGLGCSVCEAENGRGRGVLMQLFKLLLAFTKNLHPVTIQNGYRVPMPNIQQTDML